MHTRSPKKYPGQPLGQDKSMSIERLRRDEEDHLLYLIKSLDLQRQSDLNKTVDSHSKHLLISDQPLKIKIVSGNFKLAFDGDKIIAVTVVDQGSEKIYQVQFRGVKVDAKELGEGFVNAITAELTNKGHAGVKSKLSMDVTRTMLQMSEQLSTARLELIEVQQMTEHLEENEELQDVTSLTNLAVKMSAIKTRMEIISKTITLFTERYPGLRDEEQRSVHKVANELASISKKLAGCSAMATSFCN